MSETHTCASAQQLPAQRTPLSHPGTHAPSRHSSPTAQHTGGEPHTSALSHEPPPSGPASSPPSPSGPASRGPPSPGSTQAPSTHVAAPTHSSSLAHAGGGGESQASSRSDDPRETRQARVQRCGMLETVAQAARGRAHYITLMARAPPPAERGLPSPPTVMALIVHLLASETSGGREAATRTSKEPMHKRLRGHLTRSWAWLLIRTSLHTRRSLLSDQWRITPPHRCFVREA